MFKCSTQIPLDGSLYMIIIDIIFHYIYTFKSNYYNYYIFDRYLQDICSCCFLFI